MSDDAELLRRYAETRENDAFAELVHRHVNLVYSSALRQLNGDAHLAQDATQMVFADLARKAARLSDERVLAGWLFVSTRYATAKLVRTERRRRNREQEAHAMQEIWNDNSAQLDWDRVRPVLDHAMNELKEPDRVAILLRYFEGRPFAEVGTRLQLSENSARMRVERALDKLHGLLTRRGVTSSTAALAVALANHTVLAAPAGMASSVSAAVIAGVGAGVGSTGVGIFMMLSKVQIGLGAAILAAGVAGFTVQQHERSALRQQIVATERQVPAGMVTTTPATVADSRGSEMTSDTDQELAHLSDEAAVLRDQLARANRPVPPAGHNLGGARTIGSAADSKLDRMPVATRRVPPKYPYDMRKAGLTGTVVVEFTVDASGGVQDAKAVESSNPGFESAAVEAVSQWKYDPGQKGGRQVNTRVKQEISFTVAEDTKPITPSNWF